MDPALLGQLIFQQGVDEPVSRGLHLRLETLGCDDDSEVRLLGRDTLHGLVVCVEVRVVVDVEGGGLEGGGDLSKTGQSRSVSVLIGKRANEPRHTFCLMASSIGVCDAIVENLSGLAALAKPKAAWRNIGRAGSSGLAST